MRKDIFTICGREIARAIRDADISVPEVFSFFRKRIEHIDSHLKSFVETYSLPSSAGVNNNSTTGVPRDSSLAGTPIAIKDNICIRGKRITCASRILAPHIAVYDATVVKKLKHAGLNIIGVTNMDEFAFGSSTENSCYGPTHNPWDLTRVPGGSSGGSTAAVAARLVPFALGSDTGGSIRQPAAFCGVVGFKPSYGRVSRYGLVAFGSSLDQIGPITTNFIDCAHLLNIICGLDANDSTTSALPVPDFTASLGSDISDVRIGIPREYFVSGLDEEVKDSIHGAISTFKKQGAKIVEISLPHTEYATATYYIIASSEASSNLQRFDGIRYGLRQDAPGLEELYKKTRRRGFGEEARRRIMIGTYSLSSGYYDAYYMRALKVRTLIKRDFEQAFKAVDVILTPTSPVAAFKLGERTQDPLSMYLSDVYTISANLAGICAVSFPCGFTRNNLPIGVQLMGRAFAEDTLIRLGFSFQQQTDYHTKIPAVGVS